MKSGWIAVLVLMSIHVYAQQNPLQAAVDSLRKEKDTVILKERLEALGRGSERDLSILLSYYVYSGPARDSVSRLALQRFPGSSVAFGVSERDLYREEDPVKREQLFKTLAANYPGRDLDQSRAAVAGAYAKAGNVKKVKAYLGGMKEGRSKMNYIVIIAQDIMSYDPASAAALLKPEIQKMQAANMQEAEKQRSGYYSILNLYGTMLIKGGRLKEAYGYVKEAYEHTGRKEELLESNYGLVLSKNGEHAKALPSLQKLVDEGKATAMLKDAFVVSYRHVHPDQNGKAYLAAIDQKMKEKMEEEVSKLLLDKPSPDFSLKDANGKTVTLADFKGKTIVLDFWATWCGPCKKSFPSMQRVVNNYVKDPSVKFLFIHTREVVADPLADAKNYLRANKYNFDLYMDLKDATTKKNPVVTAFDVSGIPAKFVIDRNGNIRFKMIGFSGGDDAAVAELSAMIEIAKKAGS